MTPRQPSAVSRRAALGGVAAALAGAAPAHAQLKEMWRNLPKSLPGLPTQTPTPAPPPPPPAQTIKPGVQTIEPRGYSQQFQPVREMIGQGRYADAFGRFAPMSAPDQKDAATTTSRPSGGARGAPPAPAATASATPPGRLPSDPYLSRVELGLIAFESGDPETAITHLKQAEDTENERRDAHGAKAVAGKAGDWLRVGMGKVSGQNEIAPYHPLDHERVLQLNYLSLAYLLQGDRRCYNITRRCIAEQGDLKVKFEKELADYKAKYAEQTTDTSKVTEGDRKAFDELSSQFKAYDAQAARVPNAYVNPLGDYLAGVIQEIASREQPALRDNSRIGYQNALKLCGRSAQLSAAAQAMARPRVPANERVLHVIVGEGFSPQREVMSFGLTLRQQVVPVRVPIFKPVGTPIQRIAVLGQNGATLGALDPIGDFEAIRLRDQQDRTPQIMLGVFTDSLASYFTGQALKKAGGIGELIHGLRDATASPDTRSWLSLPRRFHVARLVVPASVRSVQIAAFDAAGGRVAAAPTPLSPTETQSILYARVTPGAVRVQTARRLWIDGQLEEDKA